MRLVTAQAADLRLDLAVVRRIVNVSHGMPQYRMSQSALQWETDHPCEIVFWQFHFAAENQRQVILGIDRWLCLGTMTLQTQSVSLGAQQLWMIAPVRIVAGRASLLERGLMQYLLAMQFGLIGVASQTHIHRVRLQKTWGSAGMRAVTIRAVSGCSRMLEGCGFYFLGLVRVADHAQFFDLDFDENDFAVLRRAVAGLTLLFCKRIMRELLQQLWTVGLMRIVAFKAIGFGERLIMVCFDQAFVLHIVTVETECRCCFG